MKGPKISVIIPVYNVEDYLEDTLNSLLNQTIIDDIEILMIDDGSSDDSRYIIERYALDYDNFHAFHKENGGQGVARNYGLRYANGEYIHFLDSDDIIAPDGYEKLYNVVSQGDYDFIVGNVLRFNRYNCREDKLFINSFNGLKENTKLTSINNHPPLVWDTITCNKLYKRDFLKENNIKFIDKKIFFEDLLFSIEGYCKSKSFVFSNEYFYYWRYRANSSSVTQQNDKNLKNFKDRLKVIRLIIDLIKQYELNDSTLNALYEKWLTHDFILYIKKIDTYPSDSLNELLDEVLDILSVIPIEIKENLNSYCRIVYEMIENKDIDSLLDFAPLEYKLKIDPDMKLNLNQKYLSLIDFVEDSLNENLIAKKIDMDTDEENIFIDFEAKVHYLSSKHPHKINAILIDENDDEFPLEISGNQIILPFDLIKDKKSLKIKMRYYYGSNCKESYLINTKRQSIIFNNFDFEMGIGLNKILVINVREIKDGLVNIEKISLDNDLFTFEGISSIKFDDVTIENVLSFEKISYPVDFTDQRFSFTIPYSDIKSSLIKKWELKSIYLMKLPNKITFFKQNNEIYFANTRNKILISDDFYDNSERLFNINNELISVKKEKRKLSRKNSQLTEKNADLTQLNSELSSENKKLKKTLAEFKSRKVVRAVDKVKGYYK